ncbi:hypothetical protein D3C80_1650050 [compost metagenome]
MLLLVFGHAGNSALQPLFEAGTVFQVGQRIVRGVVAELFHQFPRGADVLQHHHCPHHLALDGFQRRYRFLYVEAAAVAAMQYQRVFCWQGRPLLQAVLHRIFYFWAILAVGHPHHAVNRHT